MAAANSRPRGRTQARGDARQRILDATSGLLEEHPWHELTMADLMRSAGLTRTAFYRHFDDRHALLLAMLAQVDDGVGAAGLAWKGGAGDPVAELRAGLAELATAMRTHGRLMQAIADSAPYDADVRRARDQMVSGFSAQTAARIRDDVAAGRSAVRAPDEVAAALVRMNESVLLDAFGRPPYPPVEAVVSTMVEIWVSTIYGRPALDRALTETPGGGDQRST